MTIKRQFLWESKKLIPEFWNIRLIWEITMEFAKENPGVLYIGKRNNS